MMAEEGTPEAATAAEGQEPQQKPTETVDFWKQKAREQEKRAKENSNAKIELEKLQAEKLSREEKAQKEADEARQAAVEARQEAQRMRFAAKEHISDEDADLLLTAIDEDLLAKQAKRIGELLAEAAKKPEGLYVPSEGHQPSAPALNSDELETALKKKLGMPA
jgi:hypothetical protein